MTRLALLGKQCIAIHIYYLASNAYLYDLVLGKQGLHIQVLQIGKQCPDGYSVLCKQCTPIYMAYHKANDKDKEALHRQHESDILLFESINRQLKEMGYDKVPAFKPLKEEYDFLATRKASLDATYQTEKKKVNELASAKKNIDRYLVQDKSKVRGMTKDELD